MASLLTPETFEFFALYLLSGYVVIIVRSKFVAGLRPKPAELVIEAVVFSLIIQLAALLISTISKWTGLTTIITPTVLTKTTAASLFFYVKVLLLPTLLGLIIGSSLTAGWKNAFLRRLYLPVTHPVETGHDFAFGNSREPCFILVTYNDSTTVGGFFGENSLAASNFEKSDLYLERVYRINTDGVWSEPTPGRSGLISLSNVRSIEFLDAEEQKP
ncbi:MAG: DUF6338 family protein [Sulfitobacter sp.]